MLLHFNTREFRQAMTPIVYIVTMVDGSNSVKRLKGISLFFKFQFYFSFEAPSLQRCKLNILYATIQPFGCTKQFCILQLTISYYTCKLNYGYSITRQVLVTILHMEHLSTGKFVMSYEKNKSFLVIHILPKVCLKKVEKLEHGSFNL